MSGGRTSTLLITTTVVFRTYLLRVEIAMVEFTTQKTQLYQKEGYQGPEAIYHHETDYPSVRRDEILFSVTNKGMLLVSKLNGETMCMVAGPTLEDLEKMIACAKGTTTD